MLVVGGYALSPSSRRGRVGAPRRPLLSVLSRIKSPKVYFTETGLVAYLLGIRSPEQVASHPLMGSLFENMAVMEILKRRLNRGDEPDMYFMRTSSGLEADIVVENSGRLDLYEVKASSTFHPDMTANLKRMAKFIPEVGRLAVVYSGRAAGVHDEVEVLNFADIGEVGVSR